MKQVIAVLFLVFTVSFSFSQTEVKSKPLTIGEVKTIHSKVLNENRTLNVYLPSTYDAAKAYPVIYVLDGSINEDFIHVVGLVQFFNLQFKMPDVIVVGIANVDRKRDFTFHTNLKSLKKNYPTTGHSKSFITFLETELQPYIEKTYKTTNEKYLIGQSLGGLLATEVLLKKQSLFTHYLIVSPSLWWDDESMLNEANMLFSHQPDVETYVYVSVGKEEDPIMQREASAIAEVLKSSGKEHLTVDYLLMDNENHATILHRSLYEGFLKLFPYKD